MPIRNVLLDGFNGAPGTNGIEPTVDIDVAMSMAPGLSSVIVYEAPPAHNAYNDILNRMATDDSAAQIDSSWFADAGPNATEDQIFQQFAAQGAVSFFELGDGGAVADWPAVR